MPYVRRKRFGRKKATGRRRRPMGAPMRKRRVYRKRTLNTSKSVEKKIWVTTPFTNTLSDVQTNNPYLSAFFAGNAITYTSGPIAVGQHYPPTASNTFSAWTAYDLTPYPTQGVGYRNRIGSKIVLTGMTTRVQISQQQNTASPVTLKMVFIALKGQAIQTGLANFINNMYSVNPMVQGTGINSGNGIVDYNSDYASDFRGQYRILRTKTIRLSEDFLTGANQIKEVRVGLKFRRGHTVMFNQDSNNIVQGQIFVLFMADSGNIGGTAFSGDGAIYMPVLGATTGVLVNPMTRTFYTDL